MTGDDERLLARLNNGLWERHPDYPRWKQEAAEAGRLAEATAERCLLDGQLASSSEDDGELHVSREPSTSRSSWVGLPVLAAVLLVMGATAVTIIGHNLIEEPSDAERQIAGDPQKAVQYTARESNVADRLMATRTSSDLTDICRSTAALLMQHSVETVRSDGVREGIAFVSYSAEGRRWQIRCRLVGNRVVWSAIDAFGPGTGMGRWRDDPADSVVTFELKGSDIMITEVMDGEPASDGTFTRTPQPKHVPD